MFNKSRSMLKIMGIEYRSEDFKRAKWSYLALKNNTAGTKVENQCNPINQFCYNSLILSLFFPGIRSAYSKFSQTCRFEGPLDSLHAQYMVYEKNALLFS